jgi:hypothetical protein
MQTRGFVIAPKICLNSAAVGPIGSVSFGKQDQKQLEAMQRPAPRNPRRCLNCPQKTVARHLELCQPCFAEKTIEAIFDYWIPREGEKGKHPKPKLVHPVCAICFDRLESDVCSPCYRELYENKVDISKFLEDCRCRVKEEDGKCATRRRRK